MNEDWSRVAANAVAHAAQMAGVAVADAAARYERPSVMMRPSITIDGNQWCALYGADLQNGVAGFGDTVDEAMADFDKNWYGQKARAQEQGK